MSGPGALVVLRRWRSLDELMAHADTARAAWALVERAEAGRVAIGPRFAPGQRPCFRCYVLRRISHGATRVDPAGELSADSASAAERCVAQLAAQAPHDVPLQWVVEPDGRVARHAVLPVPTCLACRSLRPLARALSLAELVSDRVGIVGGVRDVAPGRALLPTVRADGARTDAFSAQRAISIGCAADPDRSRAVTRAVAEAVERYAAAFVRSDLHVARLSELDGEVEMPDRVRAQLRARGSPAISWVRGVRAATGAAVWLPAQSVFIPFSGPPGEPELGPLSSNGLALHTSFESALEHAVLETEERDIFVRAWRAGRTPYRVAAFEPVVAGMRAARVPCADGPPVVAAMLEREQPPYGVWGAACRRDEATAARAAQLEAVAGHALYTEWLAAGIRPADGAPRTLADHGLAHATRPELRQSRARWLEPRGSHPRLAALRSTDRACVVDLTPPDVAAAGLHVVRAILPGRVALDHDALHPFLGGERAPHPLT